MMLSTLEEQLMFILGQGEQTSSYKNSQSLSGGEHSFSIISFIMALWRPWKVPFIVLMNLMSLWIL